MNLDDEHLLHVALEDGVIRRVVEDVDPDPDQIRTQIEEEAESGGRAEVSFELSPAAQRALLAAYEESRALGTSYIGPEHVLLALTRDEESEAGKLLSRFGLSHTKLRRAVVRGVDKGGEAREPASPTPTLDEYSRDLTEMAREGTLDPVIGRADEIEATIEVLSRRTKNNPVLIGDPGVGKTAIVEGIAQGVINDEVPETLSGRRVLALDLSGMVAGTKYRGEFDELKADMDQILKRSLRPEFMNRIDEVIVFRTLDKEQISEIARLLLELTERRLHAQNIDLEFTEAAVELVAEEGFDPEFGARPLRRTIQRGVDNELSRMVLEGSLNPGDTLVVDLEEGKLTFGILDETPPAGTASQNMTHE